MDKQEAIRIMDSGNRSDKFEYLNYLDIAFDTYNRNIENSSDIVNILINTVLTLTDDQLIDEILEVIISAQTSQDLKEINYSRLAENIDKVAESFLPKYMVVPKILCKLQIAR